MLVINNYFESSEESNEEWIAKFYPSMMDSTKRAAVSYETSGHDDIKELRSEISALTEQVSQLVTLLSSKEVIQ